jgi:hypothetical protein
VFISKCWSPFETVFYFRNIIHLRKNEIKAQNVVVWELIIIFLRIDKRRNYIYNCCVIMN